MKKNGKDVGNKAAKNLLNEICSTLSDIIASPEISEYAIGITGNPETRQKSYKGIGVTSGFYLLAWGLSPELTGYIEEGLYDHIASSDKKTSIYKKCYKRIKEGPYRKSINKKCNYSAY